MREECSGVTCGSLIGCGSLQVISVVANTSFSTCREVLLLVWMFLCIESSVVTIVKKILQ